MIFFYSACEEEWRRLAASAAAETRLLSPGMQQIPNQIRTQGTPLGKFPFYGKLQLIELKCFI